MELKTEIQKKLQEIPLTDKMWVIPAKGKIPEKDKISLEKNELKIQTIIKRNIISQLKKSLSSLYQDVKLDDENISFEPDFVIRNDKHIAYISIICLPVDIPGKMTKVFSGFKIIDRLESLKKQSKKAAKVDFWLLFVPYNINFKKEQIEVLNPPKKVVDFFKTLPIKYDLLNDKQISLIVKNKIPETKTPLTRIKFINEINMRIEPYLTQAELLESDSILNNVLKQLDKEIVFPIDEKDIQKKYQVIDTKLTELIKEVIVDPKVVVAKTAKIKGITVQPVTPTSFTLKLKNSVSFVKIVPLAEEDSKADEKSKNKVNGLTTLIKNWKILKNSGKFNHFAYWLLLTDYEIKDNQVKINKIKKVDFFKTNPEKYTINKRSDCNLIATPELKHELKEELSRDRFFDKLLKRLSPIQIQQSVRSFKDKFNRAIMSLARETLKIKVEKHGELTKSVINKMNREIKKTYLDRLKTLAKNIDSTIDTKPKLFPGTSVLPISDASFEKNDVRIYLNIIPYPIIEKQSDNISNQETRVQITSIKNIITLLEELKQADSYVMYEYILFIAPYTVKPSSLLIENAKKVDFFGIDSGKMHTSPTDFIIEIVPSRIKKTKTIREVSELITNYREVVNESYKNYIQDTLDTLTDDKYKIMIQISENETKKRAQDIIQAFLIKQFEDLGTEVKIGYTKNNSIEIESGKTKIVYPNVTYEANITEKWINLCPPIPEDRPNIPTEEFEESQRTLEFVLTLRGYKLTPSEERLILTDKEGGISLFEGERKKDEPLKLLALASGKPVLGVTHVRELVKHMKNRGLATGIIYCGKRATPAAKVVAGNENIEILPFNPLGYNLFDHQFVPTHEITKKDEISTVLKKYKIRADQLPLINVNDPVVHLLGARSGDVIKVFRESPTAGLVVVYRYVGSHDKG
ncbi:MAG: DNA-directed RNA polymerase subunit H [Candidatus Ranarchaeia archaeon]